MRERGLAAAVVFLAIGVRCAPALGPHELLVLANAGSADSVEVAKEYARLRQVPPENVVRLELPAQWTRQTLAVAPEDFRRHIWEPARRAAAERGLDDHILAWAYSLDFPVAVTTAPRMSLPGFTFVRAMAPERRVIEEGTYRSPLFAGPVNVGLPIPAAQSLDVFRGWLGADMPLPSMMLGYAGPRGLSREAVLACLGRGLASDRTTPRGTVFLVTGDDIRARCRQWQFDDAARALKDLGVAAVVTNRLPRERKDVAGLMMGLPNVKPAGMGFLPGCMAEHLTSAAADFDADHQTKLTAWLEAGATASAGTVTEPYSIWMKFPSACFFVHYASGATLIESFFQSIRSPLQILPVGDPLASPWAPPGEVALDGVPARAEGPFAARAALRGAFGGPSRIVYLLDGRTAGEGASLRVDPAALAAGPHRLRAVAYGQGTRKAQWFAEAVFEVPAGASAAGGETR